MHFRPKSFITGILRRCCELVPILVKYIKSFQNLKEPVTKGLYKKVITQKRVYISNGYVIIVSTEMIF